MWIHLFFLITSFGVTPHSFAQSDYIKDHKILAKILSETYGIPSAVILGVAIVESGAGEGDAAKVLNNHFGFVGENEYLNSKGHKSRYKQYDNEIASYLDFCSYITRKKFYKKLKDKKNPRLWIHAISLTGYSEVPETWEAHVLRAIKEHHL